MSPDQWEKISEIYHSAVELEAERRKAYLDEACGRDVTLRREIESLLEAESAAGDFIAEPIVGNSPPDLQFKKTEPASGDMIGHYRVARSIGSGGMGEVYLATDTRLGRKVAIKTLPGEIADDPNYLKRFRNEALAAANINHPNAATIYSVEENGDRPFITMEYIEGQTLDKTIPLDGLPFDNFSEWFTQIADALSYAHGKGVIHRDVKPGNIMIVDGKIPKILDFGLAQIDRRAFEQSESDIHITKPGQIIGTPSYMSPEQAEGLEVDHRTDIFSFGVVMYEALTGRRPFSGDSHAEIVSNLLKSEPPPIDKLRPEVPEPFKAVVSRCLKKKKSERYQSMNEVTEALATLRSVARSGRSFESFQRRLFREAKSPSAVWIPFAVLLVFAAAMVGWYYFSGVDAQGINFSDMAFRKLSQSNNVVFAQITGDGKSIIYNTIEENEMRAMYLRRIDDRNALQLLPPQRVQFWGGLTTNQDSSQIYYITAERAARHGTLYRISSLGGLPRKLVEKVNDLGSLSPKGDRILFVRYGERAELISANSVDGSDEHVIQTGGPNVLYRDPQYSLDGKTIYVIRFDVLDGSEYWSVVQLSGEGGEEKVIIPMQRPRISELVVLKTGNGILMNATDPISNLPQLYHLEPQTGKQTRITNDLNSYFGISSDDAGETIVSAQRFDERAVWVSDVGGWKEMKKVASEPNPYLSAKFAVNDKIIFDGVDNNRPHIYSMDADGQNVHQLTPNESSDSQPQVSPDGRYIVFTSDRTGEAKIWRMNLDGSEPALLTPGDGTAASPGISPDGKAVYFVLNRNNERMLAMVPMEGGEIRKAPFQAEQYWAISPDQQKVAFTFFDESAGRSQVKFTYLNDEKPDTVLPISPILVLLWSSDSSKLFFRARDGVENPFNTIWEIDPNSGKQTELFSVTEDSITDVSFSADGKKAVIVRGKLITDAIMMSRIKTAPE